MKRTREQEEIIKALKEHNRIKVLAYAGSGKTTTLKMITEEYSNFKFLYLAFNKAISQEAQEKFPSNVEVKTTHALAFKYVMRDFSWKRKLGNIKIMDLIDMFELKDEYRNDYYNIAKLIKEVFELYCYSSEKDISEDFVIDAILKDDDLRIHYDSFSARAKKILVKRITKYIKELWQKMEEGSIPISHNFYLKYFELNIDRYKQYLNYDVVLLDEAQDTNDVTLSIFEKIPTKKKIMVGDIYQKIYGFRKSIDAMEKWEADINLRLTISFRFDEKISKEANKILSKFRKEKVPIKAFNKKLTGQIENKAYISRTNATLIEIAKKLLDRGKEFNTIRDPYEIFKLPLNIMYFDLIRKGLERKEILKEKWLLKFYDIDEIKEYAEKVKDIELISAVSLYEKYGYSIEKIYKEVLNVNKTSKEVKIFLTTAHSSKGLEWDSIIIENDFPDWANLFTDAGIKSIEDFVKKIEKKNQKALKIMEEINLFYVAITRARKDLEIKSINKKYYDNLAFFKSSVKKQAIKKALEKVKALFRFIP